MPVWPTTTDILKAFRTERGWSQARLAEALNVGRRTVEDWEAGRREPNGLLWLAISFLREREGLEKRLELMRSGAMRVRVNNDDVTAAEIAGVEARIAEYDQLLVDRAGDLL